MNTSAINMKTRYKVLTIIIVVLIAVTIMILLPRIKKENNDDMIAPSVEEHESYENGIDEADGSFHSDEVPANPYNDSDDHEQNQTESNSIESHNEDMGQTSDPIVIDNDSNVTPIDSDPWG